MNNRRLQVLLAVLGVLFVAHLVVNKPWKPRAQGPRFFTGVAPPAPLRPFARTAAAWPARDAVSLIPRSEILSGGPPKDGIPALNGPAFVPADDVPWLADGDLVVGLAIGGVSRAYPLRILVWHEIANDTVGGTPVAVTYCPLCQSTLVFDRRIGGQTREFGVSGLLYRSNVLMYDRQEDDGEESLWSQALLKAVVGPAAEAGLTLPMLPSDLVSWADWKERHPDTEVLSATTGHPRNYAGTAYASYFMNDRIMFEIPGYEGPTARFRNKDLFVMVFAGEGTRAYNVREVLQATQATTHLDDEVSGRTIRLSPDRGRTSIRVAAADGGADPATFYLFYFELAASHPEVEIFDPR